MKRKSKDKPKTDTRTHDPMPWIRSLPGQWQCRCGATHVGLPGVWGWLAAHRVCGRLVGQDTGEDGAKETKR